MAYGEAFIRHLPAMESGFTIGTFEFEYLTWTGVRAGASASRT